MPTTPQRFVPPVVVVGIDGSAAGIRAAVWAADEAVSRDIPLRLVAVAEAQAGSGDGSGGEAAHIWLRAADAAVRATGIPARVQTEAVTGAPVPTLLEASRTAAMLCIGAIGARHGAHHRIGSTASALVTAAHCPVAVIRGRADGAAPADGGWVVVEVDETPDSSAVLQAGVAAARLRSAPLRVLGGWQSRYTDVHDPQAVAEGNRLVRAGLDRRLAEWKRRYPDLDVRPVAVHGSMLNWLSRNAAEIQLVVVGARNAAGVDELLGPAGLAALHDTHCSVLVIDPQRLL